MLKTYSLFLDADLLSYSSCYCVCSYLSNNFHFAVNITHLSNLNAQSSVTRILQNTCSCHAKHCCVLTFRCFWRIAQGREYHKVNSMQAVCLFDKHITSVFWYSFKWWALSFETRGIYSAHIWFSRRMWTNNLPASNNVNPPDYVTFGDTNILKKKCLCIDCLHLIQCNLPKLMFKICFNNAFSYSDFNLLSMLIIR